MQKTTCNTKYLINKSKRIVLTLSGWTSMDKLFLPCTLGDDLTKKKLMSKIRQCTWKFTFMVPLKLVIYTSLDKCQGVKLFKLYSNNQNNIIEVGLYLTMFPNIAYHEWTL